MGQDTDQLSRVEDKLDQLLELAARAAAAVEEFKAGPGKKLLKMFGGG